MQYVRVVRAKGRPIKVDSDVAEAFELYGFIKDGFSLNDLGMKELDYDLSVKFKKIRDEIARYQKDENEKINNR